MNQPKLTVALTGASGFVGRHVLTQLLAAGHTVRALLRSGRELQERDARVRVVRGDLFNPQALGELVQGTGAVIHLVGIIMEHPGRGQTFQRVHVEATRNLVEAAQAAGVRRWIHMSALGSRPQAISTYHRTKYEAEQIVQHGGMVFTIFRPSIIHGPDGEFMGMVKKFCCGLFPPFIPYFGAGLWGGRGAGRLQPVWVEDVARCFVEALTNEKTINEIYPLGGPDPYTWPGLYETCRKHLPGARLKKKIRAVPVWYAKLIAGWPGVPFNRDQVIMSQEDSTCQIGKVQADFGFELAAFEPTFAAYAAQIE